MIEDQPHFFLVFLRPEAHSAGLRDRDILLAIDGIPVTSRGVYADLLSSSHPGSFMNVTYRRKGEPAEHQARVLLGILKNNSVYSSCSYTWSCPRSALALGFWVVAVRIQDVRAWLLLGLLLSLGTFFNAFPYFWSPPFRTLGTVYFLLPAEAQLHLAVSARHLFPGALSQNRSLEVVEVARVDCPAAVGRSFCSRTSLVTLSNSIALPGRHARNSISCSAYTFWVSRFELSIVMAFSPASRSNTGSPRRPMPNAACECSTPEPRPVFCRLQS